MIHQRSPTPGPGFTLIEALVTSTIVIVLLGIGLPVLTNAVRLYQLNAAVTAACTAIQTTRYRAIMSGYPFAIAFSSTAPSYQISSQSPGAGGALTALGQPVPLTGTPGISVTQNTTLQFSPGGTVQATQGALNFSITNGTLTKTISVSAVGDVTISP